MEKRKKLVSGGTTLAGQKVMKRLVPDKCIRDGKVCAYRTRISGYDYKNTQTSACGYCLYTGETMGTVVDPCGPDVHIVYLDVCDKFEEKIPDDVFVKWVDYSEDCGYEFDE